ncbi:35542_t:CDS:2, partial [Racocetra persica]
LDTNNLPDIRFISPTAKRDSAWEVKLRYSENLHPTHSNYLLCPEHRVVKRSKLSLYQNNDLIDKLSSGKFAETEKLVATLETKDRYIIHYRNLQQCLELGMELEHIYHVLEFNQSPWLEPYIIANIIQRRDDVWHRTRVDLVRPIGEEHQLRKMLADLALKDEFAGTQALRYARNRSKSYALETEDEYKNIQKAKGLKKSLVKKELTIDIYEHCILESTKRSINLLDSKRWILNNRVMTWAIEDCQILAYLSALEQYWNNIPQEILMDL